MLPPLWLADNWSDILSSGLCCKHHLRSPVFPLWPAPVPMLPGTAVFCRVPCWPAPELGRGLGLLTPQGDEPECPGSCTASLAVWSCFLVQHPFLSSVCGCLLTGTMCCNKCLISSFYYEVMSSSSNLGTCCLNFGLCSISTWESLRPPKPSLKLRKDYVSPPLMISNLPPSDTCFSPSLPPTVMSKYV